MLARSGFCKSCQMLLMVMLISLIEISYPVTLFFAVPRHASQDPVDAVMQNDGREKTPRAAICMTTPTGSGWNVRGTGKPRRPSAGKEYGER